MVEAKMIFYREILNSYFIHVLCVIGPQCLVCTTVLSLLQQLLTYVYVTCSNVCVSDVHALSVFVLLTLYVHVGCTEVCDTRSSKRSSQP